MNPSRRLVRAAGASRATAFASETGTLAPMGSADAQTHANRNWKRWDPVLTELQHKEAHDAAQQSAQQTQTPTAVSPPEITVSAGSGVTEGGATVFTVHASRAPEADLAVSLLRRTVNDDAPLRLRPRCSLSRRSPGLAQCLGGVVLVPDDAAVELAFRGCCAVECHALADRCS